ncbi:mitochondrial proton/calcium exchanger protein, partial [Tanacetum coccineum]
VIRAVKYLTIAGHTSPMRFHSVLPSARFSSLLSQSARFSLAASAPKPDNNEQVANPILKRSWAMLLGIGRALRAIGLIKKLVHRKTEFVDTVKLLGVDVKIGSRFLVKLVCGKSLSRRYRQQLTKLLGIYSSKQGWLKEAFKVPWYAFFQLIAIFPMIILGVRNGVKLNEQVSS